MEHDIEEQPPPYSQIISYKIHKDFYIDIYTLIFLTISVVLALTDIDKMLCLYIYTLLQMLFYIFATFI